MLQVIFFSLLALACEQGLQLEETAKQNWRRMQWPWSLFTGYFSTKTWNILPKNFQEEGAFLFPYCAILPYFRARKNMSNKQNVRTCYMLIHPIRCIYFENTGNIKCSSNVYRMKWKVILKMPFTALLYQTAKKENKIFLFYSSNTL